MVILVVVAWVTTRGYPKDLAAAKTSDLVPSSGLGNFMEWAIEGLYGFSEGVAGKWVVKFFPIVMTIFLFIVASNWIGLIPGVGTIGLLEHPKDPHAHAYVAKGIILTAEEAHEGEGVILAPFLRPPATDLNFTLALALVAVVMAQVFGIQAQKLGYFKKFFDLERLQAGRRDGDHRLLGRLAGADLGVRPHRLLQLSSFWQHLCGRGAVGGVGVS